MSKSKNKNSGSWQETLEVEREFPDLEKDIRETRREIETGEYKKYPTLEEVLAEENKE